MSGWITKKLGEVCEEIRERISSAEIPLAAYITTDNMLKNCAGVCEAENLPPKICSLVAYQSGDILLSNIRPYLKKIWLADRSGGASSDVIVLRPRFENILARYIYRALARDEFFDFSMLNVTGTKMPRGKRDWIKSFEIPIPPLAEQKRIVAKIDAAFEKIDRLKANAEKNLANAKELFQSALDEAMCPKKGWAEKRLGEIGPVCMCKRILKAQTSSEGEVPFYKIGTFGKTANAFISRDVYDRYRALYKFPRKGEVLISAAGTIGRAVVYDGAPAYFQDSNIVWVANDEQSVLNIYLKWFYATSPWHVTKGATIQRLYNENIESARIAYPPIPIQRQVCGTLDVLATKLEALQQNYAQQIADCAEMRQAILREAFEGRM